MSAWRASPTARIASWPGCAAIRRRRYRKNCLWRAPRRTAKRNQGAGPASPARRLRWCRRGLGSRARVRQLGNDVAVADRLNVAADLAAQLDLELAVADRAGHLAAVADQQALADDEVALEGAAHIGAVDLGGTLEEAALGDVDVAAILQIGFDAALDDQRVARGDLSRQANFASDGQPPHVALAPPGRGGCRGWGRRGGSRRRAYRQGGRGRGPG